MYGWQSNESLLHVVTFCFIWYAIDMLFSLSLLRSFSFGQTHLQSSNVVHYCVRIYFLSSSTLRMCKIFLLLWLIHNLINFNFHFIFIFTCYLSIFFYSIISFITFFTLSLFFPPYSLVPLHFHIRECELFPSF